MFKLISRYKQLNYNIKRNGIKALIYKKKLQKKLNKKNKIKNIN